VDKAFAFADGFATWGCKTVLRGSGSSGSSSGDSSKLSLSLFSVKFNLIEGKWRMNKALWWVVIWEIWQFEWWWWMFANLQEKKSSSTAHLITFFFLACFRLFFESSMFIGRIGADMILRLVWNCALFALTDSRPLAAAEASELPEVFGITFVGAVGDVLLFNWMK
jgi:hypothetical protein